MEVGREGLASLCSVSSLHFPGEQDTNEGGRLAWRVTGSKHKVKAKGCEPSVVLEIPVLPCGQAQ